MNLVTNDNQMANPNWYPGMSSPNPSGRPPKTPQQIEFEKNCQEYASKVWEFLKNQFDKERIDTRQLAAKMDIAHTILDRGFGKPLISTDSTLSTNDSHKSTPERIEEILQELNTDESPKTGEIRESPDTGKMDEKK